MRPAMVTDTAMIVTAFISEPSSFGGLSSQPEPIKQLANKLLLTVNTVFI